MGERSNFALNPMLVAGLEHVLEWGAANIEAYCEALTRDLLREAQELGFVIGDEAWRAAHLFGIRAPAHLPMDRLKHALAERNVAASVRGDAIRISPHLYNNAADIDSLRDALHASLKASAPVPSMPS